MKTGRGEKAGGAAALMVFCIFAMLAFSVLMLGAGAYRSIAGASRDGSDERVSLSYVWTMVKNNDNVGSVFVDDFQGVESLYVEERFGDHVYYTIVYFHEGWVYELFAESGIVFPLGAGVRVIEVESLRFEQLEGGGVMATSGETSVFISPRGLLSRSAEGDGGISFVEGGS